MVILGVDEKSLRKKELIVGEKIQGQDVCRGSKGGVEYIDLCLRRGFGVIGKVIGVEGQR
jgi:hypothetical protein